MGAGPLWTTLQQRASLPDLQGRVFLTGAMTHDVHLYQDLDIYLQPSLSEGSSMTTVEAMAMGLPVIASRTGGLAEVVIDGETGLLVPPNDPQALAEAILTLLHDPQRAQAMGHQGQIRARAFFSGRLYIEKIAAFYQDMARQIVP
ncbi:MAG: glycosyltransferase family 4 protein [Magnetococcus sp. DMHC-6]